MILSGRDRATRDLDVIVTLELEQLSILTEALREQGFSHHDRADRHRLEDVLLLRFWLPIGATGLSASLDVQIAQSEFSRHVVANAHVTEMLGHQIRLATPEDLILLKLCAFRPIDQADARELAELYQDRLNRAYLTEHAELLGISDRLAEVLP
jgi:hypothetical protein